MFLIVGFSSFFFFFFVNKLVFWLEVYVTFKLQRFCILQSQINIACFAIHCNNLFCHYVDCFYYFHINHYKNVNKYKLVTKLFAFWFYYFWHHSCTLWRSGVTAADRKVSGSMFEYGIRSCVLGRVYRHHSNATLPLIKMQF